MMLWFDLRVRTSTALPLSRNGGALCARSECKCKHDPGFDGLCASVWPPMARKSLRPHLNQIRTWTRQGRTDAWVAHQLEVTVQQIASFKREVGLLEEEPGAEGAGAGVYDDEIDLRAA